MTGFAVIEPDHALMGLYSSSPHRYTYFRPDTNKRWRIGSRDVTELPITTIREHILESYCLKIKDLGLDSVLCRGIDNINMKGEMKENNRNKGTVAVAHFANVLKVDIQAVNDGLERALTLGKILGEKIGATVTSDIESLKAEEGSEEYFEGGKRKCLVNLYERNPKLRADAISFHGNKCKVCAFDFERFYGERGCNYIEVHHLRPVSSLNGKEKVNPASDMTVLCSNCHRMIHRSRDNVLSPEGLNEETHQSAVMDLQGGTMRNLGTCFSINKLLYNK